jgi:ubiquinone/menaquinone biosynthesis C-methylase UbiE
MATATISSATCEYVLGYTSAEHERLIRQATLIAPITERFFRQVGIGRGQRVLDLGSGVGDVSMAVARVVGPTGEVVGIERDSASIAVAEARVKAAGFHNVTFERADLNEMRMDKPFDAVVGRFILMFLRDPGSVLRSVVRQVREGGVIALQEVSWTPMLALGARLPLWSRVLGAIHEILLRSGANPEMGLELYRVFQQIGLPSPEMHMDIVLGSDPAVTDVILGVLRSLLPLAERERVPLAELEDLKTLPERIQDEIAAANTVVSVVPIVSVLSRKAGNR